MFVFPYGRKNIDTILWKLLYTIQFLKSRLRGKYKEFRNLISQKRPQKCFANFENYKIRCKTSSFRSLNNSLKNYKVQMSIQLFEMYLVPFFRAKTDAILKRRYQKTIWVQKYCFTLDIFPPIFCFVFATMEHRYFIIVESLMKDYHFAF